ncbi:MAG: amidohydrolase family protein, partial [Pyrinomonadaceae bacterium]
MNRILAFTIIILSSILSGVASVTGHTGQEKIADLIFLNGNIYTVSERQPKAEAIAIKAGRILAVGSNKSVEVFKGPKTRVVDLRGSTVVPGLTDAHYHLAGVGLREIALNLEGTAGLDDLLAKLKARIDQTEKGKWVTGRGWIETFWKPQVFPTRNDLDLVSPDNPVFLTRADGHAAVANSAALKIAGIER